MALPGGLGTLEELLQVLTFEPFGYLRGGVALLDVDGFYEHLLAHLEMLYARRFARPEFRRLYHVVGSAVAALECLEGYRQRDTPAKSFEEPAQALVQRRNSRRSEQNSPFAPFTMAVVSDLHLSQMRGMDRFYRFRDVVRADPEIEMVLILGDLIYSGDAIGLRTLLNDLGVPTLVVYGNNDERRFGDYVPLFGPLDRVVDAHDCRFILMWDGLQIGVPRDREGVITDNQFLWLEMRLAEARKAGMAHVFIAAHVPPSFPGAYHEGLAMWPKVEARFLDLSSLRRDRLLLWARSTQPAAWQDGATEMLVLPSLNWNFVPPSRAPLPYHTWARQVVGGSYLRVTVSPTGIGHRLIPVRLSDE